ncbi:MAG TPA: hypothetical protein VIE64_01805 [Solirubrobacterales bacterium]
MSGYRHLLRWAALPISDRRWAAPLSAVALGFGLFVGVAIGPGADGTFGTGTPQIVEIPSSGGETASVEEDHAQASTGSGDGNGASPESSTSTGTAPSSLIPEGKLESPDSEVGSEGSVPKDEPPPPAEVPEPEEEMITGVVVHVNSAAGSYTVAEPGGALTAVHAPKAPLLGTKLKIPIRSLSNGTLAEAGTRIKLVRQMRAKLSGIVTYVDPTPAAPAYAVSKRGVSLLVHIHPDPTGLAPTLPALGAFANVAVDIEATQLPASSASPSDTSAPAAQEPPTASAVAEPLSVAPPSCAPDPTQPPLPPIEPPAVLWQRSLDAAGTPFTYGDFEGIVTAICPGEGKLRVSADDIRESGADLLFDVPSKIDMTRLRVGDSILATATIGGGGVLSLTGLASDERTKGADDPRTAQGALAGR